jgi:hypothetical protein
VPVRSPRNPGRLTDSSGHDRLCKTCAESPRRHALDERPTSAAAAHPDRRICRSKSHAHPEHSFRRRQARRRGALWVGTFRGSAAPDGRPCRDRAGYRPSRSPRHGDRRSAASDPVASARQDQPPDSLHSNHGVSPARKVVNLHDPCHRNQCDSAIGLVPRLRASPRRGG